MSSEIVPKHKVGDLVGQEYFVNIARISVSRKAFGVIIDLYWDKTWHEWFYKVIWYDDSFSPHRDDLYRIDDVSLLKRNIQNWLYEHKS
jgi:hypothetical protein